ncbi:hypothetical protein LTR85_011198 [Meristemomyces frigidus]|nr:hypothetical protein LTR85_011198 [Meristemomyces frigidus]
MSSSMSLSASLSPSSTARPDALPLEPKITPAVGIAGVILIGAGMALCLIGIKHKWLYNFLSTAFLASLAVTVLVVYVMNPPVSDAVQGAYMVAAVVAGLIFGAMSLVFKDVTEGLGCLLGGFCLAMWLLVLSPGGLISSTTGRAILIAVFCLAFLSLSFSHYTRNYGLIFCTSFAGAQIAIIGIDCFSRAGLKEFWIYIWNLNDNEFPISTDTYPVTRGIRVEIACTIILFIFGVMSQFKIWKVVKERRLKKEDDRMRDDEDRNQLESAVGREIEANNERDRAQWEAVYGDKDRMQVHVDSGVGSSIDSLPKPSASVRERSMDVVEMAEMPGVSSRRESKQHQRPTVTIRVASEDEPRALPTQSEEHLLDRADISRSASHRTSPMDSRRTSLDQLEATSVKDWSQPPSVAGPPTVVPLPFSIPHYTEEDDAASEHDSIVSKGTAGYSVNERRGIPLKRLSVKTDREDGRMMVPDIEDDGASSVAATADEDEDAAPRLSAAPSPYQLDFEKDGLLPPSDDERYRSVSPRRSVVELPLEEDDDEAMVRPETAKEESQSDLDRTTSKKQARRSTVSSHRRSIAGRRSDRDADSDDDGENVSMVGSLKDHLPQRMSKVAMTYRTNEWAKHIAEADEPDTGAVSGSNSPGIQIDRAFAEEAARPVDTEALKPTQAPKVARNASQTSNKNPYRQGAKATPNALSRSSSSGTATPVYAFQRSGSATPVDRRTSSATLTGQPRLATQGLRNISAPLASQPLVETPLEDVLAASGPYRNVSMPMDMAGANNLMDERNQRLKQKPTAMSFNALTATPNFNVIAPSDSASSRNVRLDEPESDNISLAERKQLLNEGMTLAERKAFMQRQQMPSARQGTWPVPGRNQQTIYDSHQPKRTNTVDSVKQSTMLTQWRQSLQQDAAAKQPLLAEENARLAMINQRRQSELQHQLKDVERANRQSAMDIAARSGQLHDVHRDALSRMQAKANKRTL